MRKFKVGDRIKCINPGANQVTKGKVYTITEVADTDDHVRLIGDSGKLINIFEFRFELYNPKINHLPEWL